MKNVWSALSDETRRSILDLLKQKPHTAGEIVEHFQLAPATVSHHLSVLKESGLVSAEKRAQTITYSLNTSIVEELLKSLASLISKEKK